MKRKDDQFFIKFSELVLFDFTLNFAVVKNIQKKQFLRGSQNSVKVATKTWGPRLCTSHYALTIGRSDEAKIGRPVARKGCRICRRRPAVLIRGPHLLKILISPDLRRNFRAVRKNFEIFWKLPNYTKKLYDFRETENSPTWMLFYEIPWHFPDFWAKYISRNSRATLSCTLHLKSGEVGVGKCEIALFKPALATLNVFPRVGLAQASAIQSP